MHLARLWKPVLLVRSLNPFASPPELPSNMPVGVTVFDPIVMVTAPSLDSSQSAIDGHVGSAVLSVIDLIRSEERIVLELFQPVR